MFDDQPQNGGAVPPSNLPVEPADIFDGVEPAPTPTDLPPAPPDALASGLLKRKTAVTTPIASPTSFSASPNVSATSIAAASQPILGKIILGILLLALLGLIGFGGWWLFNRVKEQLPKNTTTAPSSATVAPAATTPAASESSKSKTDTILFGSATVDTDADDLTDQEETQLGTDVRNPDTDGDGLSDGDEVKVWHTNPLKSDTDGDGFIDSEEIKNGYNPNGTGKLLNFTGTTVRVVVTVPDSTTSPWHYAIQSIKSSNVSATTTP